ncbi:MAG: glycosyltransferase family 4 protein [Candidatus Shapirobacteria bacterium]|nr:glycosyltransferase family 4 protein [Candidatus Shapirobacteria bacterium]MDD4410536.1 glycosyltransferase family 4 protein [Candidatus Shapirobacteria bacterium]
MKINSKKGILILTPFFSPNIGGVETHLTDLVNGLDNLGYPVYVHTYSPLTTANVEWKSREKINNINIYRYRWFGKNLFHKVEKYPFIDFLYLTPYLCLRTFFWMLFNHQKITTINSHGFNGAVAGNILAFFFHKKHVTSTHALYDNSSTSLTAKLTSFVLNRTDMVLAQSVHSKNQLINWGVNSKKISLYRYWVDPKKFNNKKSNISPSKFKVLFVSRLIIKKGTRIIIKLAKKLPNIEFVIIGSGPESKYISQQKLSNINFLGKIDNHKLIDYYSTADVFIQPALYQEGFTRTIMEAVASGLPVIASDIGTIPEIVDESVSILVKPTVENFKSAILKLKNDRILLNQMKNNCPSYTKKYFNINNIKLIVRHY